MTQNDIELVKQMIIQAISTHKHISVDSQRINYVDLRITPETAIDDVTGTATGTYGTGEQNLINQHTTTLNDILTALRNKNIIDT